ncbi:MAG TPA: class I SAM-dependent methyltransferase [Methylomirabilota bacterium]|nr:class I SAM-dependent methyltransferase [Methylomirabilota bacterium]
MTERFGPAYASAYDALYQDKDYLEETRLIDRLLRTHGAGPVRAVLDLGCGTGNHALLLAQRGYQVVGVDGSAEMLEAARQKAALGRSASGASFHQSDIAGLRLQQAFDAALMMFAVLGYQLENRDVLAALRAARKHLRQGGLFIFDVWHGPAVLCQGPSERVKSIRTENGQLLRAASGRLDIQRHRCQVNYRLWKIEGERLVGQTEETHLMRYFFPLELELFLESSQFALVRLGAFPEFERDPDTTTWSVLGVARAV